MKLFITIILIIAACVGYGVAQKSHSFKDFKAKATEAKVLRAIDGDTIEVQIVDKKEIVRLIGIDTPELKDNRPQVKCFAQEAKKKAAELEGSQVKLEADPTQADKDRYGRLLRYVWIYNPDRSITIFNQVIIRNGYAYEYTYDKPYKYQTEFKVAQRTAENNKWGLWDSEACK